jgi:hypothetical protein
MAGFNTSRNAAYPITNDFLLSLLALGEEAEASYPVQFDNSYAEGPPIYADSLAADGRLPPDAILVSTRSAKALLMQWAHDPPPDYPGLDILTARILELFRSILRQQSFEHFILK